jgi:ubiquinone/menaquinone biosynthesis C-methylase UbiE
MTNNPSDTKDTNKARVQAYFSRTAASYVSSPSHSTGSDLKRLIEIGEWNPGFQAIDIATGGGHTALAVSPHVSQITVTDLTPAMLEQAKIFINAQGITNAHFQVADAENLPFGDSTFERATCRIAPHHFSDVPLAVSEIARVLKPHGLFLLIDSCVPGDAEQDLFANKVEKWRDSSHVRSYTQAEWQTFFNKANLEIEQLELFRRAHDYEIWTERSQLPSTEKKRLEDYILSSSPALQNYFEVVKSDTGHLVSFSMDYIIIKGRKK